MKEEALRRTLEELLRGGQAHATTEQALEGLDPPLRGRKPAPGMHSPWEELEHMRIAQEDILRYTLDPEWESPPWPGGYWPPAGEEATEEAWAEARDGFFRGRAEVLDLAGDPSRDLTALLPHGEGRTYLRQVLLVADHNAYHTACIVQARKLLGNWPG